MISLVSGSLIIVRFPSGIAGEAMDVAYPRAVLELDSGATKSERFP